VAIIGASGQSTTTKNASLLWIIVHDKGRYNSPWPTKITNGVVNINRYARVPAAACSGVSTLQFVAVQDAAGLTVSTPPIAPAIDVATSVANMPRFVLVPSVGPSAEYQIA
jgi:hypothetical protein